MHAHIQTVKFPETWRRFTGSRTHRWCPGVGDNRDESISLHCSRALKTKGCRAASTACLKCNPVALVLPMAALKR